MIGFVLPMGYAFNLDGSMIYQAFAILFIAQVYGVEMSLATAVVAKWEGKLGASVEGKDEIVDRLPEGIVTAPEQAPVALRA